MTLNKIAVFTVGDWSNDGHGKTDTFVFKSNKTLSEIETAYLQTVMETGLDLKKECQDYEEATLSEEFISKLKAYNIELKNIDLYECLSAEDYTSLYLAIAKISLPDLKYKEVSDKAVIGGYGLFYD